jgi:HTH-type transcriptional regulator, competence development regulator
MNATFGELLRERRRAAGLSQRKLAELVGVDFSYVSKLENDRLPPPSSETVVRLAEAIGAAPDEFLAVAKKIPDAVGDEIVGEPAAQRFLRLASSMKLSRSEWEALVGELERLRGDEPSDGEGGTR